MTELTALNRLRYHLYNVFGFGRIHKVELNFIDINNVSIIIYFREDLKVDVNDLNEYLYNNFNLKCISIRETSTCMKPVKLKYAPITLEELGNINTLCRMKGVNI